MTFSDERRHLLTPDASEWDRHTWEMLVVVLAAHGSGADLLGPYAEERPDDHRDVQDFLSLVSVRSAEGELEENLVFIAIAAARQLAGAGEPERLRALYDAVIGPWSRRPDAGEVPRALARSCRDLWPVGADPGGQGCLARIGAMAATAAGAGALLLASLAAL